MKRSLIIIAVVLALGWTAQAQAECKILEEVPTYTAGHLKDLTCDTSGNLQTEVITGTSPAGGLGTATAVAPTLSEAQAGYFSWDLSGNLRMALGVPITGSDTANNAIMTESAVVRLTQLVGTGGVPSTASDATGTATTIPAGDITFHGIVTCTGTCVQTQKIYGSFENSATVAKSVLVCTLTMNASTTAVDWCSVKQQPFYYYFVVTSNTSGTTPLAGLFAMYN